MLIMDNKVENAAAPVARAPRPVTRRRKKVCVFCADKVEFIARYFRKGSAICLTGSIQTRTWQDAQGQKRYATEVVVDEAMFVDSKNEGGAGQTYTPDAYATPSFSSPMGADTPRFEELKSDDDLPF